MTTEQKNTIAAAEAASVPDNLIAFRPRASSLAVQTIAAAGVSEADEALGRVLADHARFATEADARKWKVAPGEIFMMTGGTCGGRKPATVESIAAKMGLAVQTVHNRRSSLKRAGVIEVRRCSRTRCSIVFRIPGTLPPASWRPVVKTAGNTGGKTEGKTDQEPRKNRAGTVREPVQRAICFRCGGSWPASYGYRCRACERDTRDPCMAPVICHDGDEIRCRKCTTCRPDRKRCAGKFKKDGQQCIYTAGHNCKHKRGAA